MSTKIEWTDETWNPVRARRLDDPTRIGWHCEHKSPGCGNCYAETMNIAGRSTHTGTRLPYKPGHRKDVEIFVDPKTLLRPLSWKRPRKIFVCSMTDLFADFVTDDMIDQVFAIMALCRQHTFQVLTKRPERMREYCSERLSRLGDRVGAPRLIEAILALGGDCSIAGPVWPLPNVWMGVSVEDQERADERREDFKATPAAVKFVSYEPALGPVDWTGWCFVHQIISGGESGPRARPTDPQWHRDTRDWCGAMGIAFLFKQWGTWHPDALRYTTMAGECPPKRLKIGKKAAGRLLDGRTYDEYPEIAR